MLENKKKMGRGKWAKAEPGAERASVSGKESPFLAKSFPKNAGCVRLACQGGGWLREEWQFSEATLRGTTLTNKRV